MKIFKSILVLLSIFLLFYLLGSFYNVSFDISKWSEFSRYTITFFGGLFSILAGGLFLFKDEI